MQFGKIKPFWGRFVQCMKYLRKKKENSSLFQNDLKNKEGRLITLPVGALQPSKANQEYSTQAQTDGSFQGD